MSAESGAVARFLRQRPLSVTFALALLVLALVTGPIAGPRLGVRVLFGGGWRSVIEHGHWWAPLTSSFLTDNGVELVLALVCAVLVLGFAERLMGSGRTALVALVGSLAGIATGLALQVAGVAAGELWSRGIRELGAVDPFTPMVAALVAASWFTGPLWRRRIRVLSFSTVGVLLLFGGQPSDLYRALAALAGFVLGAALSDRTESPTWRRSSFHERRSTLAALVGLLALGPIITVYSGGRFGILAPLGLLLTQDVPAASNTVDRCLVAEVTRQCARELTLERLNGLGPVLVSVLPLVALAIAAIGMARGRRFGAHLAIVLNLGTALVAGWYFGILRLISDPFAVASHHGRYWEIGVTLVASVLAPLALAAAIAANTRAFRVQSRAGILRRFAGALTGVLIGLSLLYLGLGWLLRDQFHPRVAFIDLVADLPERFIPIGFLRLEPLAFRPDSAITAALSQAIGPIFWGTVIVGALLCLRSAASGPPPDQRARLDRILLAGGGDALSFMSTWDGNSLWFDESGTTAIAYRMVDDVAITIGGPIGPADAAPAAIAAFARMCDDQGWTPVFYSVDADLLARFEAMGWPSMRVAEEAVLHPRSWSTTGKKWQDIRSSINRADRAGIRVQWSSYRALSAGVSAQITEISEQWMQNRSLPEMGFTLGGLDELRDDRVRLMLAIGPDDRVEVVTSWLPSFRDGVVIGWTLDVMRRRAESINGVMEFVIAKTAERMSAMPEVEFLSLSAAPLAPGTDADAEESAFSARVLDTIGRRIEPVYGFRSLLAFKRKFQPEFRPLYMAYPDQVYLLAIGAALARAYLPTLSIRDAFAFMRRRDEREPVRAARHG